MKVLVASDQQSLLIEVPGAHNIYDPYTGKKLESAFARSSYQMVPTEDGVKWGQTFPGIYQIMLVPDSQYVPVVVNGIPYGGVVLFYQAENRLAVVNWVSLEDFVSSLLSTRLLPSRDAQKEALAVYAILARSLAYAKLLQHENQLWDCKAEDFGYQGRSSVRNDDAFVQAIQSSKDVIVTRDQQGQDPYSQPIEEIFQRLPYQRLQELSERGQNAKDMLHRFYPDYLLRMIPTKKNKR